MSQQSNLNNVPPKQAMMTLRIIWAGLLLGELGFMGLVALQLPQSLKPPPANAQMTLVVVNLIMLVTVVPVMFFIRRIVHQRTRRPDGTIPAGAYSRGNVIFWAGCEGVSFFGLVAAQKNCTFWPTIGIVAVALALQVITYPKMAAIKAPDGTFRIE